MKKLFSMRHFFLQQAGVCAFFLIIAWIFRSTLLGTPASGIESPAPLDALILSTASMVAGGIIGYIALALSSAFYLRKSQDRIFWGAGAVTGVILLAIMLMWGVNLAVDALITSARSSEPVRVGSSVALWFLVSNLFTFLSTYCGRGVLGEFSLSPYKGAAGVSRVAVWFFYLVMPVCLAILNFALTHGSKTAWQVELPAIVVLLGYGALVDWRYSLIKA